MDSTETQKISSSLATLEERLRDRKAELAVLDAETVPYGSFRAVEVASLKMLLRARIDAYTDAWEILSGREYAAGDSNPEPTD